MAESQLVQYLKEALGVPEASGKLVDSPGDVGADVILETPSTIYVVETKAGVARQDAISQLAFMAKLAERKYPARKIIPVLVVPTAPRRIRNALKAIGGELVEVPPQLLPVSKMPKGLTPLTTEQSWKVVTTLLRLRVAKSIRPVAQASGASLGWTYRVLSELEARGIAEGGPGGIRMTRPDKLLDIVPFERSLEGLSVATIRTDYEDAHEAAVELTRLLSEPPGRGSAFRFAFCGYTAAGLYTGYARRFDRLDLYSDEPALTPYLGGRGTGVSVRIYKPDRAVFDDAQKIQGVRVVSLGVALLDVAGLGFAARDIATKVLETYARVDGSRAS